jgi:hypothetical protein
MPMKFIQHHSVTSEVDRRSPSSGKKLWTILTAVLATCLIHTALVRAELASEQEMLNVSQNFVTQKVARIGQWAGDSAPTLSSSHELRYEGVLVARYYDVSPRGYVLVPVLKEMSPVKAYSDESNLDSDQEGGFLQMIGEVLYKQMRLYETLYGSLDIPQPVAGDQLFDAAQKQAWQRLEVPVRDFRVEAAQGTTSQGGPLLTSSWHQREPFNNDCPMGDGGRTVVGCVATATAQILKFWEWPAAGVGFHYYYWAGDQSCENPTPAEWLLADYSDSYDWANIPDDCNSSCTQAQSDALAELNYEVGVALNMNYSHCGSGASTAYAAYVFPTYFKYKSTTQVLNRVDYTQQGWFDLIRSEIDAGRPIQYRINLHSIVCDGYRDDFGQREFHMNYGWNNGYTTWFVLDDLYCYWILPDSVCPYEEEFLIAGIEPQHDPVLVFQRADASDIAPDGDGLVEAGETAQIQAVVVNQGFDATSTMGTLSTSDPYLTITGAQATFDPVILWGAEGYTQTPFELTVDPGCPNPHVAKLKLDVTAAGFVFPDSFYIFVGNTPGFEDDVESGPDNWSSRDLTVTYMNEWHLETSRYHSGATSWKAGGAGSSAYADLSDGALLTPPLLLPPDAKLSFWHWIDAEDDANFTAWDGAIVMIRPNGGFWTQISPQGGYPYTIIDNPASPFASGTPCYSGSYDWTQATFDLSAYSGVVQLMFRFGTDAAANFEGWYVDDVWVGNTVEGTDVQLSMLPDLSVTFESVLTRGVTTATISETGPLPPQGYGTVPSAPAQYYDLSTDAVFSGNVDVCITYDEADITRPDSVLRLFHFEADTWTDVTTSHDTETNTICGSATTLSPFLVAERLTCCVARVGDANGEGVYPDEVTLSDIMLMVDALFISGDCGLLPCLTEADVTQDGGASPTCEDNVKLGDIMTLVDFLFISGPETATLPECL